MAKLMRMSCRSVQRLLADPNHQIDNSDRLRVEEHLTLCENCRSFAVTARQLSQVAPEIEPTPASKLIERRAVLAALENRMPQKRQRSFSPGRLVLVGACAASFVLLVSFFTFTGIGDSVSGDQSKAKVATAVGKKAEKIPEDKIKLSSPQQFASRSVYFDDSGEPLQLQAGTRVWGSPDAALTVEKLSPLSIALRLHRGTIVADVVKDNIDRRFTVSTPNGKVEVRGTVFSVAVVSGKEITRVIRGVVEVTDYSSHGQVHVLNHGEQVTIGHEQPIKAIEHDLQDDLALAGGLKIGPGEKTETPILVKPKRRSTTSHKQLVNEAISQNRLDEAHNLIKKTDPIETPVLLGRLARAYRQAHKFNDAAQIFDRLITEYPKTSAANNAMVALGQLEAGVLKSPEQALKHFNLYLTKAPSGFLAEEAWVGIARILSKLGRSDDVIKTVNGYLDTGPGSSNAEMLRYRAIARAKTGDCKNATKDLKTLENRWPSSPEVKRTYAGIGKCFE